MFIFKHRGFPELRWTDGNVTGLTGKGLYGIVGGDEVVWIVVSMGSSSGGVDVGSSMVIVVVLSVGGMFLVCTYKTGA